jgi:hypothetical protein
VAKTSPGNEQHLAPKTTQWYNRIISIDNVQRGHFEPFISRKSFPLFWGVFLQNEQTGSKPEKTFQKLCGSKHYLKYIIRLTIGYDHGRAESL